MNLLLVDPGEISDAGEVRVAGRRAAHLREVVRAAPGRRLPAGALGGPMGEAEILAVEGEAVRVRLILDRDPPPPSPVSLVLALPRPKILRRVLRAAAAGGVKRIALVGSWRVEKSYFASPFLAPASMAAELCLGLEQGRDTVLPEVAVHRFFKPFIEDVLPALGGAARLLAHERAPGLLETVAHPRTGSALLAVGPEGGFTPYEVGRLGEAGFAPFSLGPRALRVDQAVPFALGQVELWLRAGG